MIDPTRISAIQALITDLRNRRDTEKNFHTFQALIDEHAEDILTTIDLRWLVSICDTYVDYGNEIERRNALLVSLFVNMIRLSDTYMLLLHHEIDPTMLQVLKTSQLPLFNGLMTLHIDRQDTCLNLAKRLTRLLAPTPFFLAVYHKAVEWSSSEDSLLNKVARISTRPEFLFPNDALTRADNYGII